MKKIRTIIWDCDNVMWFHKPEEVAILAKALNIEDVKELAMEHFSMLNTFNSYFANKKVTLTETYKIIEHEMPILFFHGISPKRFMRVWGDLKFELNNFNKDVLVVIEYLQNQGLKNVIKTDWWRKVQEEMLKEWNVLKYIERLYCCDNSYLKCNPLSAKEIIKPGDESEFLIIGDSLTSDIAFAKHSGIKSIWFNRDGKKKNNSPYKPDFEVVSLLEVMEILKIS